MQGIVDYSDSDSDSNDANHGTAALNTSTTAAAPLPASDVKNNKLNFLFLPHSIQLALARGDCEMDSDSGDESTVKKQQGVKIESIATTATTSGSGSALLSALPKPREFHNTELETVIDSTSISSTSQRTPKWVLPTSAASWTTTVVKASDQGKPKVHMPHEDLHVMKEPNTLDDNVDLFTLSVPNNRSIGYSGITELSASHVPAPWQNEQKASHIHLAETDSVVQSNEVAMAGNNASSSGRSQSRKRMREIEHQLKSGNLDALQHIEGQVIDAQTPAEWDSSQYTQRKHHEQQIRSKYNASVAEVSALAAGVTQTHKRKNQITSLAVSAVEMRVKQADGSTTMRNQQDADNKKQYGW